uniref:Uncharacterized protein n=1 Tax=Vitis vinifera TaxID=29760 RepID=F6I1C6_VITVI
MILLGVALERVESSETYDFDIRSHTGAYFPTF